MSEKTDSKRQLIIDKATEVFAAKGYRDVTMKDIVEACNISRGGLYLYFESTKQIFLEVLRQEQEKGNEIYFFSDNIVTVCPKCKELRNVARLTYQLSDGVKRETFIENCDSCGEKPIAVMSEPISCPKCGKPMEHKYAGNWD